MSLLCSYCQNIDFAQVDDEDGYQHHDTMADLLSCAEQGSCDFCALIAREWNEGDNEEEEESDAGPLPEQKESTLRGGSPNKLQGPVLLWRRNPNGFIFDCMRICENTRTRTEVGVPVEERQIVVEIHIDHDSQLAGRFDGRPLNTSGDSESCLELCRQWLDTCQKTHLTCGPGQEPIMPKRVIDLGLSEDATPKLQVTGPSERGDWIVLSWCWGHPRFQPPKTTRGTLADRERGIPIELLPPLFKDAFLLTRRLGYRYIWIDSLCIIQDDATDWIQQAAEMGNIYKNSVLCISAEASPNCQIGIFEASNVRRTEEIATNGKVKVPYYNSIFPVTETCYIYPTPVDHRRFGGTGPLGYRAWTFQESALSSRELIWTGLEVKWHCCTITLVETRPWSETFDTFKRNFKQDLVLARGLEGWVAPYGLESHPLTKLSYSEVRRLWRTAVEEYTRRSMTYSKDVFPAISAVAKEVQEVSNCFSSPGLGAYYAGLWGHDLHMGLLWILDDEEDLSSVGKIVAPSWSWVSTLREDPEAPSPTYRFSTIMFPHLNAKERLYPSAKVEGVKNTRLLEPTGSATLMPHEFGEIQQIDTLQIIGSYLPVMSETDLGRMFGVYYKLSIPIEDFAAGKIACIKISRCEWIEEESNHSVEELGDMSQKTHIQKDLHKTTDECEAWCLLIKRTKEDRNEYKKVGVCVIENGLTEEWETAEILLV